MDDLLAALQRAVDAARADRRERDDDLDDYEPPCPSPDCPAAPDCGCSGVADLWTLDPRDDEPDERRPHCLTTILDGRDHCGHEPEGPFL